MCAGTALDQRLGRDAELTVSSDPAALSAEDAAYEGSTFAEVEQAIFANPYQRVWGAEGEPPLPVYKTDFATISRGMFRLFRQSQFLAAATRTVDSSADLRWGPDGKGFPRLVHPNGVCMTGLWEITEDSGHSGYFKPGSRGLAVVRCSSHGTATTRGNFRSYSLVGKIFPTTDPTSEARLRPANFFTQDDLGGTKIEQITGAEPRNAPDITGLNRRGDIPILIRTGLVFNRADAVNSVRQLYEIAELGKPADEPTRTPRFMRLTTAPGTPDVDEDDYRDEIMAYMYDRGDPTPKRRLVFDISVSDTGEKKGLIFLGGERHVIENWHRIGTLSFDQAVVSFNGDFVIHFHHPSWRKDRDDPATATRIDGRKR
jgi:hypothetical protein